MAATNRPSQFYAEVRSSTRNFWNAYLDLRGKQSEWNALNYGSTLADGTGVDAGIVHGDLGAVCFATMDAVKVVMDAGSATNIAKIL